MFNVLRIGSLAALVMAVCPVDSSPASASGRGNPANGLAMRVSRESPRASTCAAAAVLDAGGRDGPEGWGNRPGG